MSDAVKVYKPKQTCNKRMSDGQFRQYMYGYKFLTLTKCSNC